MAEIGLVTKYDNTELIKGLEKELELQEKLLSISGEAGKELAESVKEASTELAKANQAFDSSATKIGNAAKEADRAAKATQSLSTRLKGAVKDFKVFGVSINDVQDKLASAKTNLSGVNTVLKASPGLLNKLKIALVATGIGAFVVVLGSLFAVLTRSQKGIDAVNKVLAATGSIVDNVIERFVRLGDAIFSFGKGAFAQLKGLGQLLTGDIQGAIESNTTAIESYQKGIDSTADAFGNLKEFAEDANAALQLEAASQQLRQDQRALRLEYEQTLATIEKLKLAAEDEKFTAQERIGFLSEAQQIESDIETKRLALAEENLRILKERNALAGDLVQDKDAEIDAEIALAQIQEESAAKQTEFLAARQALENEQIAKIKEQQAEAKKLEEQQQKALEAFEKELASFQDSVDEIRRSELTSEERIEAEKNLTIEKIKEEQKRLEAVAASLGKEVDLTDEFNILIAEAERQAAEELFKLEQENREKRLQAEQQLADDRLDIIRRTAEGEVISLQFSEDGIISGDAISEQEADRIKNKVVGIVDGIVDGAKEGADGLIDGLDLLDDPIDQFFQGIFKKIGVDEKGFEEIKEQFGRLSASISQIFTAGLESQIQAQDELIAASKDRLQELEKDLEREQDLADEGKANSLASIQEQVDLENSIIEEAEAKKREIQESALKAQLISDQLLQASSLAVAAAQIFSKQAGIPIVGVVTAIATIAAMIAAFKAFKSQVASLTSLHTGGHIGEHMSETGGLLKGPTDKPGQGKGMRIEGTNIVVGGNEFVMKEAVTTKNLPFLRAMNQQRYAGVDLFAAAESALNYNSPIPRHAKAITRKQQTIHRAESVDRGQLDRKAMQEIMNQAVKDTIKGFGSELQKDTKLLPVLDENGQTIGYIQTSGNLTRRVMF